MTDDDNAVTLTDVPAGTPSRSRTSAADPSRVPAP